MPQEGRNRAHAAAAAACIVLSFAAFGRGIPSRFVSDDNNAILTNEYVTGHASAGEIFANYSWWGVERADAPGYRPLTTWTFARTHKLFGPDPAAFHALNLFLHSGVCIAVYVLALSLGLSLPAAAFSAALFAVMPIHSEAVVWAVGRAELLAALGFLACVLSGLRFVRGGSAVWAGLSAAALVAGVFSKENAVTALAAPAVVHLWLGGRQGAKSGGAVSLERTALWTVTLCAGLAVYLAVRVSTGEAIGRSGADGLDNPLSALPWLQRQAAAVSVFGRYLWLSLVPLGLSVDYSYDALGIHPGSFVDRYSVVGTLGIAATLAAGLAGLRSRKWTAPGAAGVLSLAAFSIVSNTVVVIGTAMGERLFYLPSLGLCIAAGALFGVYRRRTPRVSVVAAGLVLLAYTLVSAARCADWQTPVGLFEATVAVHPRSARAHMELASAYGRLGERDRALQHFEQALTIKPDYAAAAYNRANMLARAGRYDEATQSYEVAIAAKPRWGSALYNLSLVKRLQGDATGALEVLGRLKPGSRPAAIETLRGEILLGFGRNAEAVEAFTLALSASADRATTLINRGVARERLGGCADALQDYDEAARAPGAPPQAAHNAATCRRALGRSPGG